jgi:hypothetical protein
MVLDAFAVTIAGAAEHGQSPSQSPSIAAAADEARSSPAEGDAATRRWSTPPPCAQVARRRPQVRAWPRRHLRVAAVLAGRRGTRCLRRWCLAAAFVAGYEIAAQGAGIACRVRESMHPSGTWGTVGAAAAVAKLMGSTRPPFAAGR